MTRTNRYGMTIPVAGARLHQHQELFRELVDLGYTDVWTAESDGADGLTPLALAAAWAPELRLGVVRPSWPRARPPGPTPPPAGSSSGSGPGRT